jgi:5-dehydro-2-deoxygluconokinase
MSSEMFDLLCAGRACVDLYAEQDGARLEEVESFRMYLGGGAANTCVAAARMGLRTMMLTGVGVEAFGSFVLAAMRNEGIDTAMVKRDPGRLTALAALAIRPSDDFPRIFYYTDSADMAICSDDVNWEVVAQCRSLMIGGAYLSNATSRAMSLDLARFARARKIKVIFDIDFRPVLWGLVPIAEGNRMSARSDLVAAAYAEILPLCDLVVGTTEEVLAAANADALAESITTLRSLTGATVVVKRGHRGCAIYEAGAPADAQPADVPGFPVTVVNSVGAGDGFMGGFLAGWLRGESLRESATLGNACGAIVVSRHGCTPAMPTRREVDYFIANAPDLKDAYLDPTLKELHRLGTRERSREQLLVLAFDHRWQLEDLARPFDSLERLPSLKNRIYEAFCKVAGSRRDVGVLVDSTYGAAVLEAASGSGIWIGRALDVPKARPVQLEGGDELAAVLRTWPLDHTAKVIVYAHPADPESMMQRQVRELIRLHNAARVAGRELLVELQTSPGLQYSGRDLPDLVSHIYQAGVRPDWWKLPPNPDEEVWRQVGDVVRDHDPNARGILILGQLATEAELIAAFRAAAGEPLCRGFAVGRGIFAAAAGEWLAGRLDDAGLVDRVAERFQWAIDMWDEAHRADRRRTESAVD